MSDRIEYWQVVAVLKESHPRYGREMLIVLDESESKSRESYLISISELSSESVGEIDYLELREWDEVSCKWWRKSSLSLKKALEYRQKVVDAKEAPLKFADEVYAA